MMLQKIRGTTAAAAAILALGACSGGATPEPEPEPAPAPSPAPEPAPDELEISITPHSGDRQTDVTVQASGFEAGARVGIGVGLPRSEYEVVSHATADADGRVTGTVNVPDWVETDRDYLFVAVAPDGDEAISSEFHVEADAGDEETVRVTGELTGEGVECPALRTDGGELYTLAGDTGRFGEGDRVEVEGTMAESSYCMQGTTITVEHISDAG